MTDSNIVEVNLAQLYKIQQEGRIAVPSENGVDFISCPLPDSLIYSSRLEVLDDLNNFGDFLKGHEPTFTVRGDCSAAQFAKYGFKENDPVAVYAFMSPKFIKHQHAVETLRINYVESIFSRKLETNTEEKQVDTDPFHSANHFDGSLGIGLYIVDPEGFPHCLAAADIKYPARSEFEYEKGGSKTISGKYIRDFLSNADAFRDNEGKGLIIENYDGEPDFIIQEDDEGRFLVDIKQAIVGKGDLPLDTLLKKSNGHKAHLEIGQFAGNGEFFSGTVILACHFIELFEEAISIQPDLRAGFTLSPLLLKQINLIRAGGLERIFQLIGDISYGTLPSFEKISAFVKCFSRGINLYPVDHTKVTKIIFKDGRSVFVRGGYQADSWEDPAYYYYGSLTHLFS